MRSAIFAVALLAGTAAIAQSTDMTMPPDSSIPPADAATTTTPDVVTPPDATMTPTVADAAMQAPAPVIPASGQTVAPSNAHPERDARGIAVISAEATVPPGYNGTADTMTGTGGPLVDPADTNATASAATTPDADYPACTRAVTDNCLQTYERHRRPA